jgi:hypothetical protein
MMQGYPPPSGYGPPPSQQGYYGGPPPKKGMHGCLIALIIGGILTVCMFGGCVILGMVSAASTPRTSSVTVTPATTTATTTTSTSTSTSVATTDDTAKVDPLAGLPDGEKKFCVAVVASGRKYKAASSENELKRSKIRGDRTRVLNSLNSTATGWVGKIDGLSTTGDGKAALKVKLPCGDSSIDVVVMTWNNGLSDIEDNTLIAQSSKLYDALSDLGTGKRIKFSGSFVTGDETNGYHEASLSESGSMTDPEFIMKFSSAAAAPKE